MEITRKEKNGKLDHDYLLPEGAIVRPIAKKSWVPGPRVPTGYNVDCAICHHKHPLVAVGPRSRPRLTFYCDECGAPFSPMSEKGQQWLRSRIDGPWTEETIEKAFDAVYAVFNDGAPRRKEKAPPKKRGRPSLADRVDKRAAAERAVYNAEKAVDKVTGAVKTVDPSLVESLRRLVDG